MIDAAKVIAILCRFNACTESFSVVDTPDMKANWEKMDRPDWMITWLRIIGIDQAKLDNFATAVQEAIDAGKTMAEAAKAGRATIKWTEVEKATDKKHEDVAKPTEDTVKPTETTGMRRG